MFIGAALCMGQPVWAADDKPAAGPNPEQIFKELDKNADGQLSADEVTEERKRFFERLVRVGDANSDGKLSAEEFQKASKADDRPVDAPRGGGGREGGDAANFEERFKRMDTNGDDKITREEIPEAAKQFLNPLFDRLGKNELTKEEFLAARGQGRGPGAANGLPGGGNPEEFFKRLDTNNDGKLTLDEAPERGRQFVERLLQASGKGNDGSVTKEEFLAAAAKLQGARGEGERKPEGAARDGGDRKPEGAARGGDRKPEGGAPREGGDRKTEGAGRDGGRGPEGAPRGERKPEGGDRGPREGGDRGGERKPEGAPRDGGGRGPEGAPRDGGRGPEGPGRRPVPRFFEKIDANHDGRISAEEFAKANDFFKELDENGDGQLDPRELMGPPPGGGREGMNREGGDRPGANRKPEGDRPEGRGGDGRGGDAKPREERREERNADGERGARAGGGERLIKQFDKNGDGKISLDEAPDRLKENFGRLDANGDGQIEASELPERGDLPPAEGKERRGAEGDRPAKPEGRARPEGDKPRN